jgi:hypothetical protein
MAFPKNVKSKQNAPIVRPHDFVNIYSLLPNQVQKKKRSSSKSKKSSVKSSSSKSSSSSRK